MTRYKLLKSSISLEDFEGLLAFLVAEFEFDKNQAKPCLLDKLYSCTGKSLSEALIFASTNPQYVHENCKLRIPAEHVV